MSDDTKPCGCRRDDPNACVTLLAKRDGATVFACVVRPQRVECIGRWDECCRCVGIVNDRVSVELGARVVLERDTASLLCAYADAPWDKSTEEMAFDVEAWLHDLMEPQTDAWGHEHLADLLRGAKIVREEAAPAEPEWLGSLGMALTEPQTDSWAEIVREEAAPAEAPAVTVPPRRDEHGMLYAEDLSLGVRVTAWFAKEGVAARTQGSVVVFGLDWRSWNRWGHESSRMPADVWRQNADTTQDVVNLLTENVPHAEDFVATFVDGVRRRSAPILDEEPPNFERWYVNPAEPESPFAAVPSEWPVGLEHPALTCRHCGQVMVFNRPGRASDSEWCRGRVLFTCPHMLVGSLMSPSACPPYGCWLAPDSVRHAWRAVTADFDPYRAALGVADDEDMGETEVREVTHGESCQAHPDWPPPGWHFWIDQWGRWNATSEEYGTVTGGRDAVTCTAWRMHERYRDDSPRGPWVEHGPGIEVLDLPHPEDDPHERVRRAERRVRVQRRRARW